MVQYFKENTMAVVMLLGWFAILCLNTRWNKRWIYYLQQVALAVNTVANLYLAIFIDELSREQRVINVTWAIAFIVLMLAVKEQFGKKSLEEDWDEFSEKLETMFSKEAKKI